MKHGVYQIRNTVNNKAYVGSTACNRGFVRRFRDHKTALMQNQHANCILQNAWNKYGKDAFEFEILIYCDPENCLIYEQLMLDYFKPEYNICKQATNHLGVKRSQETCNRISKSKMGKLNPNYRKRFSHQTRQKMSKAGLGSKNNNSRLVERDVLSIFQLLNEGISQKVIANHFGCSKNAINDINTGRTWKHLRKIPHNSE